MRFIEPAGSVLFCLVGQRNLKCVPYFAGVAYNIKFLSVYHAITLKFKARRDNKMVLRIYKNVNNVQNNRANFQYSKISTLNSTN